MLRKSASRQRQWPPPRANFEVKRVFDVIAPDRHPQIGQAGAAALQAGDAVTARQHFEQLVASGHADATVWVALAVACQALKDEAQMLVALDKALALEPRNLRALIMKGDHLAAKGNARAAVSFYEVVLALASQSADLPPAIAEALPRVKTARSKIHGDFEAHLRKRLAEFGYDERTSSARFAQSLDMLTGKKQRYIQEPRSYFFPELPNTQFYPRSMFPWLDAVEAATENICAELSEISKKEFVPYIQTPTERPINSEHKLLNSLDWSAFFLWKDGAPLVGNAGDAQYARRSRDSSTCTYQGAYAIDLILAPEARRQDRAAHRFSKYSAHLSFTPRCSAGLLLPGRQ